jgi:hypothetical protein
MLICRLFIDYYFLRNSFRTATYYKIKSTIHIVQACFIFELICLLLFLVDSLHNIEVLPDLLLRPDSLFMLVHESV